MAGIFESIFSEHTDGRIISIGLTISTEQARAAIKLSSAIAEKYKEEFALDIDKRPPFVRLYETVFPARNVEKVKLEVEKIASEMIPFPMNWGTFEIEAHNVIVWGELSDALDFFHRAVLLMLNPLREGYHKQKYKHDKRLVFEEEKSSLQKWGSPWAENYLPHMIIAKSVNKFGVNKLLDLDWHYNTCLLNGIIVGEKSPHGSLKEFHIFPLKGK